MTDVIETGQTMTSLQIAEVTGKRHCEVLRAIRKMELAWEKVHKRKFAYKLKITEIGNQALRETPYYELTKTECLYIATKFNDEARARLILRWEQLEIERLSAPKPAAEAEILPSSDEKCLVFFADSEEMCNFAAFTREGHSFKASPENINGIKSAEVSCASNGVHLNGVSSLVNSTHPRTFLFMFTRENQVCLYNGSPVTFKLGDGTTSVNATQMAKPFGKLVGGWLRLESTKEFLNALSADMRIHTSALIQTVKGGNGEQGTWMHEDVALEFARWLSPKFAIWCNRRIKELLAAPQQPAQPEILPPPVENQQVTSSLIEYVDGKAVTTSRILARVLGRKHDSVLDTIKNNLGRRSFKYGNFTMRDYTTGGPGHGYEFVITRKGLAVLASVMRHNAGERIAEAYAGVWGGSAKLLPAPTAPVAAETSPVQSTAVVATPAEPLPTAVGRADDADTDTDTVSELVKWVVELRSDLRKARMTMRTYAEMYENEKSRHERSRRLQGHWQDLYHDLMWRLLHDTDVSLDARMAAHKAFCERMNVLNKVKDMTVSLQSETKENK